MFTVLVIFRVVLRANVNFLDSSLLFYSDVEVQSAQSGGRALWHSLTPNRSHEPKITCVGGGYWRSDSGMVILFPVQSLSPLQGRVISSGLSSTGG